MSKMFTQSYLLLLLENGPVEEAATEKEVIQSL